MISYVSLLRGINVSGHNMIKMAELKALCESLGLTNVSTYIQSGNVVYQTNRSDPVTIGTSIERAIEKKFGFLVTVITRRPAELARVITACPFLGAEKIEENRLYVTFLKTKAEAALVKSLELAAAKSTHRHKIAGTEVYLYCPNGYGKTLLSNTFFEKQLKVRATTRNWKTVNTLYAMASNIKA